MITKLSQKISKGNYFKIDGKVKKISIEDIKKQEIAENEGVDYLIPIQLQECEQMLVDKFGFKEGNTKPDFYHFGLSYFKKSIKTNNSYETFKLNKPKLKDKDDEEWLDYTIEFADTYLHVFYLHEVQNAFRIKMGVDIDEIID